MANATQTASTLPTSNFCGDKIHAYFPFSDERMILVYESEGGNGFFVIDADADMSKDIIGGKYYAVGRRAFQGCDTLEHALHVAATWATTGEIDAEWSPRR
jgi:hypothetical protein|tara:strand:+ start:708 stop:1010 length:303 start_codon:yes stop_codon:yes gene_type:complete